MESQKRIQADSPEFAQRISRDWWKCPFDLAVLCAVHIALAPVWLILWTAIPLAIRISDRGPVFYIQERVGRKRQSLQTLQVSLHGRRRRKRHRRNLGPPKRPPP